MAGNRRQGRRPVAGREHAVQHPQRQEGNVAIYGGQRSSRKAVAAEVEPGLELRAVLPAARALDGDPGASAAYLGTMVLSFFCVPGAT